MSRLVFAALVAIAGPLVAQPITAPPTPPRTERGEACTPRELAPPPVREEARPGAVPSQPYASESISAFPPQFSWNGKSVQLGVGDCEQPPTPPAAPPAR